MLAITSAVRGEGKSVVAANLAAALGELGIRSILISCDLRSPTVHRFFGLPIAPGITDAMYAWDGRLGFRRILTSTRAPNVSLISGGSPSSRPASILASNDLHNLLRYAREEAQIVILDTPAILLSGDAVSQIQDADAVLLVARLGKTTLEAAERVGVTLERLGAHVIGHALNGSRSVRSHWRRTAYRVAKGSPVTVVPDLAPARTPGEA
jgi:capsular exopolysaccharide synthesis family protein